MAIHSLRIEALKKDTKIKSCGKDDEGERKI